MKLYIEIYATFPRGLQIFLGKREKKSALFQDYTQRYSYHFYALDVFAWLSHWLHKIHVLASITEWSC